MESPAIHESCQHTAVYVFWKYIPHDMLITAILSVGENPKSTIKGLTCVRLVCPELCVLVTPSSEACSQSMAPQQVC